MKFKKSKSVFFKHFIQSFSLYFDLIVHLHKQETKTSVLETFLLSLSFPFSLLFVVLREKKANLFTYLPKYDA